MLKKCVAILTGSHLCHNPRVLKEAATLQNAGYGVKVLGSWSDAQLKTRDQELLGKIKFRYLPVLDLTAQPARRLWLRLRTKLANGLYARTGRESHWQLGFFASALAKAVRQSQADLVIAHLEQALFAISQRLSAGTLNRQSAIGNRQSIVGVDMEDWFSEDLPPEARTRRPMKLLKSLEQRALKLGSHSTCTSQAMSVALANEYGCRPPAVIYNSFPWADRETMDGKFKDRRDGSVPSLHWYSQTLGTGRGLEELFAALPHVKKPLEVHLRGNSAPRIHEWIAAQLPPNLRARVFVHDLVSNDELLSRIAEHDIGFAGEQKFCRNRDLTVTNKILHYMLGGLAVVGTDTAGQMEIAAQAKGAVQLYPAGDPLALASKLNFWLDNPEQLLSAKASALRAAEQTFCWEKSAVTLQHAVQTALSNFT